MATLEKRLDRALRAADAAEAKKKRSGLPVTTSWALLLSRALRYEDRASFARFARMATIGHWAEVIEEMRRELEREGRDPETGEVRR